ncbi:GntR family transcriptional regulator, partial [Xanthomonas perforans]
TACFRLQRISVAEDGREVELDIESWLHDALDGVVRTEAPTRSAV